MHKEVEKMMQETRSTSFQGRLLKHNLDSEVVDALKDLRDKLSENETKRWQKDQSGLYKQLTRLGLSM